MNQNDQSTNIWSFLNKIPALLKSEFTTTAGRVNLVSDLVLAAVVVAIFAANTFERITIAIVSIWNQTIAEHLSSADVLTAFIILVVFFFICLVFVFIAERFTKRSK